MVTDRREEHPEFPGQRALRPVRRGRAERALVGGTLAFGKSPHRQPGLASNQSREYFCDMMIRGESCHRCDALALPPGLGLFYEGGTSSGEMAETAPLSRTRTRTRQLHELLVVRQDEVLRLAREKATARSSLPRRTRNVGSSMELFARQLMTALALPASCPKLLPGISAELGSSWLSNGVDPSELVRSYGDVCQATLDLASECATPVDAAEFLALSCCLNEARARALAAYQEQREQAVSRREARQLEQLGRELERLLDTALRALATLQTCGAPLHAPAEALLDLTLCLLQQRIDQALQGARAASRPPLASVVRREQMRPLARSAR